MTRPRILITADSLTEMEMEAADWFKRPLRLVYDGLEWCVCFPDGKPFGAVNSYFVVRQGAHYRLESREKIPPANIVHHEQEETAS